MLRCDKTCCTARRTVFTHKPTDRPALSLVSGGTCLSGFPCWCLFASRSPLIWPSDAAPPIAASPAFFQARRMALLIWLTHSLPLEGPGKGLWQYAACTVVVVQASSGKLSRALLVCATGPLLWPITGCLMPVPKHPLRYFGACLLVCPLCA